MSTRDLIGQSLAAAKLEVARAIGVEVSLTHKRDDPITLQAVVIDEGLGSDVRPDGVLAETGTVVLDIPVQDGLEKMSDHARPICEGDKISYQGRTLFVLGDIGLLAHGHIYRVSCRDDKSLVHGVRS